MTATAPTAPRPERRPPATEVGFLGWAQRNLFATWPSAIVTIVALALALRIGWAVLDWALFSAVFSGADGSACAGGDTCARAGATDRPRARQLYPDICRHGGRDLWQQSQAGSFGRRSARPV